METYTKRHIQSMENPMKTIRRVALALPLALIFVAGVSAQDTCRVKIRIAAFKWDNANEIKKGFISPNQTEWWLKEGQKKFPGICITTTDGDADYVVAWTATESADTYTYTVPKTETTEHRGTINTTSTSTGSIGSTNTTGTYQGTSTTTTYENRRGEWPVTYVNAFVYKMSGTPGEKIPPPSFITKHKGQWRWSKPDKDSFVKSLEFIHKQTKNRHAPQSPSGDICEAGKDWPKN